MFFDQFYEKRLPFRQRNIKLLLETVTYIRVACIIKMETVICIMHCRKYHLHNYNKNCYQHVCCRNCHLHMCCRNFLQHNCNRDKQIITERQTNIQVTESTTSKSAKMQQTLSLA